ncbi:hypothetical protein IFO70_39070 [Phormidium tenue FACHB-886]|nr:hypothetical protein [Phormidium tenue FACHB-886]
MKQSFALTSAALVLGVSASLIAGSIVINSQKALAYRIDDPTPRAYPTDSPRTYAGQSRIDDNLSLLTISPNKR